MKFSNRIKKALLLASFLTLAAFGGVLIESKRAVAYQLSGIGDAGGSERNRVLITVFNDDAVAHEVGDVVVWSDGSTHDDGIEITTTTTAHNNLVAGVVALYDIPGNSFGYIQTSGYHAAVTIGVANSAGDALVTSTTAEAVGVFAVTGTTTTTGTAVTIAEVVRVFSVVGIALEATTSSSTVKVLLNRM